jgi:hypothetical protein
LDQKVPALGRRLYHRALQQLSHDAEGEFSLESAAPSRQRPDFLPLGDPRGDLNE